VKLNRKYQGIMDRIKQMIDDTPSEDVTNLLLNILIIQNYELQQKLDEIMPTKQKNIINKFKSKFFRKKLC
jgi:hypothetical protein